MTAIKRFTVIIFCVIISSVFYSCGDLSRSKAKNLILQKINSGDRIDKTISIGFIYKNGKLSDFGESEPEHYKDILIEKGYITPTQNIFEFEITYKSSPFIFIGLNFWACVEVATLIDINITGMTGDDKHKRVEFEEIYTVNSLGKEISYSGGLTRQNKIDFVKYDDGWRIN